MSGSVFYIVWIIIGILVSYNLVLPIIFFCLYKILPKKKLKYVRDFNPDYAIIVTAYKHLNTLDQAVYSLLGLNYNNFKIYVVADNCEVSGLHFSDERVIILRPEKELRSNTASHLYAVKHFERNHDFITIIDSDNLAHPEYLNQLNRYFLDGYLAVQGVRKAKNLNSLYACLDAAQDIYYHFYDREILFSIGSSSTLAGSGMAFQANYYRDFLKQFDIKGAGFDKLLQIQILKGNHRIAFARDAIIYDEKTSRSDQLVKQRARWFNTWFKYAGMGVNLLGQGIFNLNKNQFIFALMFLRPPLFLVLFTSVLILILNFFVDIVLVYYWAIGFFLFLTAFFIAMIHSKANKKIYKSLVAIPLFMFYQMLSLLKIKKANKISVATQHFHTTSINDLAEKQS
jgi:cellulose synthase/poly-beta-1,6-N-acetylglucosamine synthase-like glycosyltransferase